MSLGNNTIGTHYDMGVIAVCSIWISVWPVVNYLPIRPAVPKRLEVNCLL
jgi:hypothetical protein